MPRLGSATILIALPALLGAGAARAEPVELRATPVALDPAHPGPARVGRLTYRGGVQLQSASVGELSALYVSPDGAQLVAVSDRGYWLRAALEYDALGDLAGVTRAETGPLADTQGRPLEGKAHQDAESLVRQADGSWIVGFERQHRLWRYPAGGPPLEGPATPLQAPKGLRRAPENGGVEALALLRDGRLVIVTEELPAGRARRGFVRTGRHWHSFAYPVDGLLRASDAAELRSGALLVLERGYSPDSGVVVRLRHVAARELRKGALVTGAVVAELRAPLAVDNFEGLAVRGGPGGETFVYLLSDDNLNPQQRTLLMMFTLDVTGLE